MPLSYPKLQFHKKHAGSDFYYLPFITGRFVMSRCLLMTDKLFIAPLYYFPYFTVTVY